MQRGAKQGAQGHTTQHYIRWRRGGQILRPDRPTIGLTGPCVCGQSNEFCWRFLPSAPLSANETNRFSLFHVAVRPSAVWCRRQKCTSSKLPSFSRLALHSARICFIFSEMFFFFPRSEKRITEDGTFYIHITFYLLLNIHSFKLSTLGYK